MRPIGKYGRSLRIPPIVPVPPDETVFPPIGDSAPRDSEAGSRYPMFLGRFTSCFSSLLCGEDTHNGYSFIQSMCGWSESRCFGCCEMCLYALVPAIVPLLPPQWYGRLPQYDRS